MKNIKFAIQMDEYDIPSNNCITEDTLNYFKKENNNNKSRFNNWMNFNKNVINKQLKKNKTFFKKFLEKKINKDENIRYVISILGFVLYDDNKKQLKINKKKSSIKISQTNDIELPRLFQKHNNTNITQLIQDLGIHTGAGVNTMSNNMMDIDDSYNSYYNDDNDTKMLDVTYENMVKKKNDYQKMGREQQKYYKKKLMIRDEKINKLVEENKKLYMNLKQKYYQRYQKEIKVIEQKWKSQYLKEKKTK
jgi:hypothetical protein